MSPIAAANRQIVSRPQTTHVPTPPAPKVSDSKPVQAADATPAAPAASPTPAPQALNANAMSVLIDVQAKLQDVPGKAAQAVKQVIEKLQARNPAPAPTPAPQPIPIPARKPVVIPGGDTAAATLSSAAVAARLLEEGGMLQMAAQRSAAWAQQRADQQVADANTGITLLKATLSGYEAWQGGFSKDHQVSISA